MFLDTA